MSLLKPGLLHLEKIGEWSELGDSKPGYGPNVSWVVHYEVSLCDLNRDPELAQNPGYDLGYIFELTVCSQIFRENPPERDEDLLRRINRGVILPFFSEEQVKAALEQKLADVGEVTTESLGEKLSSFLITDEWDWDGHDE